MPHSKIIIALSAFVVFAGCAPSPTPSTTPDTPARILSDFAQLLHDDVIADDIGGSVAALVVRDDAVIWSHASGWADAASRAPADSTTIYRIGSITKTFTGMLMMLLVEDGTIGLDDPVARHLPEIELLDGNDGETGITFRHLASHTAGLVREPGNRDAHSGPVREWEAKVLESIPRTSLRSEPGERFRYSNIGYAVLGLALSRAAGVPYMELVESRILDPLGMVDTHFIMPDHKTHRLATGMGGGPLAEIDYELPLREHEGRGYKVPNGSLYSTPRDMARFMICLLGHSTLITPGALNSMQSTQTPTTRMRNNYGFGLEIHTDENISTVGHGGSTPGYSAHVLLDRESGYGVVLMRNANWGNTNFDLRAYALLRSLKAPGRSASHEP